MKIQIILEVDAADLDWGNSSVYPAGNGLYDFDLDTCKYQGQAIEFADTDEACEYVYLQFLYGESDQKDYAHA